MNFADAFSDEVAKRKQVWGPEKAFAHKNAPLGSAAASLPGRLAPKK